jgi:hypothetical protein
MNTPRVLLLTALLLASTTLARAQVVLAPSTPQVGSSNPVTAEPPVSRPHVRPCVVPLFQNLAFADFTPKSFAYTPPAACPGPWAKVVFTADFTVSAGRQFDRTAAFYLGHANIYYGTTAEPRASLSPSWHVERDVTDLSSLLAAAQTGEANLGNFIGVSNNVTYNGVIYANAALEFYPAGHEHAPRTPDLVVPVNGAGGDAGTLDNSASQITQTLNLPTNIERAYLDVIAQSQSNDEFWYFCVPDDQAANLESCGGTPFRETEVWIDGQPAGVAPVYPWIYTGGIDPYLWEPIPGVQTLDFRPYRVDLTPFAGLLSDGAPHVLAVSVYNANGFFLATANLLLFTDHGATRVSGGLLSSTLTAPVAPLITENIQTNPAGPTYTGSILVTAQREFSISGYVDTSHGRVTTTLEQSLNYRSNQQFNVSPSTDIQNVQQSNTVSTRTTSRSNAGVVSREQQLSYPLSINFDFVANPDGTFTQTTSVEQKDLERVTTDGADTARLANQVRSRDTLNLDASFKIVGPSGSASTQTFTRGDADGRCYSRTLRAAAQQLTAVSDGGGCAD